MPTEFHASTPRVSVDPEWGLNVPITNTHIVAITFTHAALPRRIAASANGAQMAIVQPVTSSSGMDGCERFADHHDSCLSTNARMLSGNSAIPPTQTSALRTEESSSLVLAVK